MNTETFAYKIASEISEFVKNNYKNAGNLPSIEFYWTKDDGTECSFKYILKGFVEKTKGLPASKFVMNDTIIEIGDKISEVSMVCGIALFKYSQRTPWRNTYDKEIDENYFNNLVEEFYRSLHYIFDEKNFEYKTIINK